MNRTALCAVWIVLALPPRMLEGQAPPATASALPADLEAVKKRADAAREANHLEDAAAVYREAVRQHPRWTEGHWYLGTISYELGNYSACQTALQQVVRVQTKNGAAWGFKGLCEYQLKKYQAALDSLTRANRLGVGEDADFLAVVGFHRALLLTHDSQFERALDEFSNFVRGGNTGATIAEGLGMALLRVASVPEELSPADRDKMTLAGQAAIFAMGRMKDAAEAAFKQLVTRYPDTPNVHYVYGTYLRSERPPDALEQFKIELTHSPTHVPARVEIAQELVKQGDVDGARPYAEEAARLAPRNFAARRILGQIRLQAGDLAGAITELEAARQLEPSSPSVHFHLARAYQRAGRDEEAKRERAEFSRLEAIQQKQRGAAGGATGEEPVEQPPQ